MQIVCFTNNFWLKKFILTHNMKDSSFYVKNVFLNMDWLLNSQVKMIWGMIDCTVTIETLMQNLDCRIFLFSCK